MTHEEKIKEILYKTRWAGEFNDLIWEGNDNNFLRDNTLPQIISILSSAEKKGLDDHEWCDKIMASEVGKAFDRGWNEAIEAAVKVAEETEFETDDEFNLCSIKFHGCQKIADKIKELRR